MKNKTVILFLSLLLGNVTYSQTFCQFELQEQKKTSITFESDEILQINGKIPISFNFSTHKSITIDSLKVRSGSFFSLDSFSLAPGHKDSGISENHSFNLMYDTATIPYYIKEIIVTIYSGSGISKNLFWIYFTPYNTIEILNNDNLMSNRRWITGDESLSPVRNYVSKDSIAINIDTTLPVKYKSIDGFSYLIPVNYDSSNSSDSFGQGNLYKSGFVTFRGNVSGTLIHEYLNELSTTMNLKLEGIKVLIWKERKNKGDKLLAEGTTNNQGFFSINYDHEVLNIDGEIKVYVQFLLENNSFSLVWSDISLNLNVHDIFTETRNHNLSNGNRQFFDFGTLALPQASFGQVFHWANRAINFAKGELNDLDIEWKPFNIIIAAIGEVNTIVPTRAFYQRSTFGNNIQLNFPNTTFESTIYHEVGHYVQHMVQDEKWVENAGGTHVYGHNNKHPNQTITEGFADGFQFIVDSRFFTDDDEAITQLTGNGGQLVANYHDVFDFGIRKDLHGFTSEAMYGCALLDLWDSKTKFEGFLNTTFDFDVMDFDAFNNPQEKADFTFKEICMPFYHNKSSNSSTIQNVPQYFKLLSDLTSSCIRKGQIRDVTGLNLRNTLSNATVDFRAITTDNLKVTETIQHINHNLTADANGFAVDGTPENYNITYTNLIDFNLLDGDNFSITPIGVTPINGISKTWSITDPITIENEHSFFFNSIDKDGFLNGNTTTHSLTSTISETDVCNDFNLIEGLIEIGNSSSSNNQHAKVNFINANLNIASNATLRINNNSKLIIEEGATLEIWPGSRIILDGDNAILEIRGTLNVHDGATFTFEGGTAGSGHVVFNTTSKNNIKLGTASKIKFVGTNSSDRVMEVMADYMFWPDNAQLNSSGSPINANASFEIQNGLVALGHNARLNIGTAMTLNNVRFYAEPTSKAKGIVLWGNKHTINNVTLENVYGGIQSFNTVGGNKLTMAHVTVSGANVALLSDGKGSYLNDFESDGNFWGIHVNGSEWPNNFYLPKVNGAQWGTMYTGGFSSSNLVMNKPDYEENEQAVSFTGSGNLVLDCGRFYNVNPGGGTRGNGITQYGGRLILNDALGYMAGRVTFKDNINTLFLNQSEFYLNNGYNDLSYEYNSNNNQLALRGSSSHKTGSASTIKADNNLWHGTNAPSTQGWPLPSPPLAYQNYNITCQAQLLPGFYMTSPVNIPSTPFLTLSQFTTAKTARCINGSTTTDKGTKTTSNMITTTHFNNTNLQDAVGTILDNMHNTAVPDYGEVIDYWAEILTEVSYVTPYSEEDYYYIDLAESKMMEALGLLLSNDTTLELSESGQSHFETVLNVQDTWIELLDEDTTDAGKDLKNSFHFDKGAVYHLEGENSLAQSQWLTMQLWANQQFLDHTDFWLCRLERENALKNCGNNPDSIANIPECQYSEGENQFVMKDPTLSEGSVKKVESKISKHLTIYPNPANTLVTVELETNKNETATITIYSIDGKCVKTLPNIKLQIGKNKLFIPVFDIAPGIYSIGIETKNSIWNEKVKVE